MVYIDMAYFDMVI